MIYEEAIYSHSGFNNFIGMNKGILKLDEPMSAHTSWRVGGYADRYYVPTDLEDLRSFLHSRPDDESYTWIGLGSNLLIRDGGIRGSVISMVGVLDELSILDESRIKIGAGVTCAKAARFIANSGYKGAEFLAGIPGTIGGALAMNAGAFGRETWDIINQAETINRDGDLRNVKRDELNVDYRYVNLPNDEWFISATFELVRDIESTSMEDIKALLKKRNDSQPTNQFTCGSVFRNPQDDYAGRLIEEAGLKAYSIGGASVSDKHANFIVNNGTANARDIELLINHIRKIVKQRFNIELELEVRILGEHADADPGH